MKIAVAQIPQVVGAFATNVKRIREAYERACAEQARLLLTPELGICGYPPLDLIDRPEIFERNEAALAALAKLTKGQPTALVVGHVARTPVDRGKGAQNAVSVLEDGKVVFTQAKTLLPTYDVFDEARYFEPATSIKLWECDGERVALAICEDLWGDDPQLGRHLYGKDPVAEYQKLKPTLLLSISASPYEFGKRAHREELHRSVAAKLGTPFVYVNQVGATDEILFDGASFALDAKGALAGRLPVFKAGFGVFDVAKGKVTVVSASEREDKAPSEIETLQRALVTGIREYFGRTGFSKAVLGLSGGIDSAVVAVLACEALGSRNVLGLAMPSQYSSSHSLADAETLAKNLNMPLEVRPIKFMFSTAKSELTVHRGELAPLALENLQSRLRGLTLMTLSNHYGALVFTTGNKSELATGYCTLYGDMCGAIAPLGDLLKTRVYELARHLNAGAGKPNGGLIPESTMTKAPSAELKPDQKDQDTLPPYELLDELIAEYVEKGASVADLEQRLGPAGRKAGQGENWVRDILRKLEVNEYKRRQAAPVLKISHKAFGVGRRIPIAKTWDQ